ncbi:MAG: hypothetical protein E7648_07850 [Ruminococcaceae bacterium]|nr:hypothetical protein [Oscillospiraceae bacterium]
MKVIKTILIFALVFVLTSCVSPDSGTPKTKDVDFSKIDKIEVTWSGYPVLLSDEQTAYVISLWREGQWKSGQWKISPDYEFKAGNLLLKYDLSSGIFVDRANDRHLIISDEQIEVLKSYLATVSADAIAEITVGMTLSQVASILMSPGTPVSDGYQYVCDDGSKFIISFVYDDEIKAPVVTGITKIDTEA